MSLRFSVLKYSAKVQGHDHVGGSHRRASGRAAALRGLSLITAVALSVACGGSESDGNNGGSAGDAGSGGGGAAGSGGSAGSSGGSGGSGDSEDCPSGPPRNGDFCGDTFMDSSDCHYDLNCSSGPQRVHYRCQSSGLFSVEPEACVPGDLCDDTDLVCDAEGVWRHDSGGCPFAPPTAGEACEAEAACRYRCTGGDQSTELRCVDQAGQLTWVADPACPG